MTVLKLVPNARDTKDAAQAIRNYADQVERGEIENIVIATESYGEYEFYRFTSISNAIVLSSLLLNRMHREMEVS